MSKNADLECAMPEERAMRLASRFLKNEQGATSIEYGLICSLLFLAIVGAINTFATSTNGMYSNIAGNLK